MKRSLLFQMKSRTVCFEIVKIFHPIWLRLKRNCTAMLLPLQELNNGHPPLTKPILAPEG